MSVRRLDPVQPSEPFAFTAENLSWARQTIAKYPAGKQASAVIPLLWRAQEQNDGWVSRPAMEYVGQMLGMPYIRVYEVATFYTMFQLSRVGKKAHIQVCGTTPCMLRGAEELKAVCRRKIHVEPFHLNEDGSLSWEEVECLGACVNAPMVQVWKDTYEDLTPETLEKMIDTWQAGGSVKPGPQNGRQMSMALSGATTLTDPSLYGRQRTFARVEAPPPPPPPAAPAAAPPSAAPPAVAPAAPPIAAPVKVAPAAPTIAPAPPVAVATPAPVRTAAQAETAKPAVAKPQPIASPVVKQAATNSLPPPYVDILAEQIKAKKAAKGPVKKVAKVAKAPAAKASGAKAGVAGTEGPALLSKPRSGKGDDLKLIWGVGPALERMLNKMGVWHFDQIAAWTAKELAWVDKRLEGFSGRAQRDEWVAQSKKLAAGWRPDKAAGEKPTKGRK
jgi:NADH-quinone oxidoreductase subunit E